MSCWVVPTVAAELWECHIDRITNAIRDGHLKTKEEAGWMFVDISPDSPVMETGTARWAASPWAGEVISQEEMEALVEPMAQTVVMEQEMPQEELVEVMADNSADSYLMQTAYQDDQPEQVGFQEEESEETELPALHIASDEDSDETAEEDSEPLADFRKVRQQVGKTRIAPRIRAA